MWVRRFTCSLFLSALVLGSGCSAAKAEFEEADRKAIIALLKTQQGAWNQGDIAGFMEGYERSPDLVFTGGGEIERGWQSTLDRYRERYGGNKKGMGTLAFEILEVRGLGGDGAVVLGRYVVEDSPRAGSGVFSVVLERGDAGWKIVHDHSSSDPDPKPAS